MDKKHFNSLVSNGFDFLFKAIEEFDSNPKYSVIHSCAAIEIFFKARLLKEHWVLVISKMDQASKEKFAQGDFISVTLDETIKRLENIANESFDKKCKDAFKTLASHRNRLIHFHYENMNFEEQIKERIAKEQCIAWHYLHTLLKKWGKYFDEFSGSISSANNKMKTYREYLQAKFDTLQERLEKERKDGTVSLCNACGYEAAILMFPEANKDIAFANCLVCDFEDTQVAINCPACDYSFRISESNIDCPSCDSKIRQADIYDQYAENISHRDAMNGEIPLDANCSDCEGYHTVVPFEASYFCTECFGLSNEMHCCEYCCEYYTGRYREDTNFAGCCICEGGYASWKDD